MARNNRNQPPQAMPPEVTPPDPTPEAASEKAPEKAPEKKASYMDGYRDGMMRAHRLLLEMTDRCRKSNTTLTYVGLHHIAWELHNLSKDSNL